MSIFKIDKILEIISKILNLHIQNVQISIGSVKLVKVFISEN
jgi:hypothetical protein